MPPPIQRNSILISIRNKDGSSRPDIKCNQEPQSLCVLISNLKSVQGKLNNVLTEMVDKDNQTMGMRNKGVQDSYGDEDLADEEDDDKDGDALKSVSKSEIDKMANQQKTKKLKTF